MKKTRKIVSFMLAIAMMISLAVPAAFAADFSDVPASYQYYDAVQSLVVRGIINGYEDGTFQPEASINRAEFCKMVIYAIGLGELSLGEVTDTGFPDVATDHWAAGVIKTAFSMKIINGFDDGTFKPDEAVTYEQAVKMVVSAASSKLAEAAMNNGGYPNGFMRVANSYGFTKSITDGIQTEAAKRGTIAKLMDNMLKADLKDKLDDSTMPEMNQMQEIKGQVVAVYGASLESSASKLTKYQVKVQLTGGDTKLYDAENLSIKDNLRSYLGKMVIVYYNENVGLDIQELSSLTLQKGKNAETTVEVDTIEDYTNTSLSYYDTNGDTEKISVSGNAKILYNGSLTSERFETLVENNINNSGSIRFLSTTGSGGAADVVFFTVYKNIYVSSINASSKIVYGEKGESYTINDEDKSKSVTITRNGTSVNFSAIAKGQILSISESLDNKFMEVLISTDAPSGRVTAMTRDENEITIASKKYKFASSVAMGSDIEVGVTLKLYLDAFGRIAKYDFQTVSTSYTYGYLTQIEDFGTSLNPDVQVKILNLSSSSIKTPATYKLADKVTINNATFKTATDYANILTTLSTAAQRYSYSGEEGDYTIAAGDVYQPIKFTLSGNKIDTILVGKNIAETTDADLKVDATALGSTGLKCTTRNTTLAGIYVLNSNTKVLYVPEDRSATDEYVLKIGTSSGFEVNKYYRALLVDLNTSNNPAVVVVYAGEPKVTSDDWLVNLPMVVTKKASNVDGNTITVQGYTGSEVAYIDEGTSFFNQVSVGDVVRIQADSDKKIEEIEVVVNALEVYNAREFVKISRRQESSANIFAGDLATGTSRRIREGDNLAEDRASMSLIAGTAFSYKDKSLVLALDYPEVADSFDKNDLGNEEKLQSLTIADSTKVIAVNFSGKNTVKSVDTAADAGQLSTYEYTTNAANKLFVYRAANTVRMLVIFRADQ